MLKPEMAQNYADHAPAMSLVGLFRRGLRYGRRSYKLRKELDDAWGQAQSLNFIGILLYAASHFRGCIRQCRRSIATIERLGDMWEQNMARFHVAAGLYRLGELSSAVEEAIHMHQLGRQVGDVQASGIALDIWAKAALGNVPTEILQDEFEHRNRYDAQAEAQILQAVAIRALADGDPAAAVAALQNADRAARTTGVQNAYVSPVLPWLATALRRMSQQHAAGSAECRSLLRAALSAARRGRRVARRFRNDLPHALREEGLLLHLLGKPAAARRRFDQSLQVAKRWGMRYEYAQTLYCLVQVGRRRGWAEAADRVEEASQLLREFDAQVYGGERGTRELCGWQWD